MPKQAQTTERPAEHALLVAVDWNRPAEDGARWSVEDSLEELARLAETAGIEVVGAVSQRMARPHSGTYVGKGKLAEIVALREDLGYDLVIADDELSPGQQRHLEDEVGVKVLDRTALILDIFAQRAQTHEGRLQVEVALLEYRLPRLTRMWTHLSRQAVGGVGLRGPGETQLEVDRRAARARIAMLKEQLKEIHLQRELYRERRRAREIPVVAIVGYTNAGKSTLLNALTDAGTLAEDKLFATLDPTTRRVRLPAGREVLITDTVGFINNLPTMLVAAFRSTLEEVGEADIILHVLDITHPNAAEQAQTVRQVLGELGVAGRPTLVALNKIDLLDADVDPAALAADLALPPDVVPISGEGRIGLDALLGRIEAMLEGDLVSVTARIPYARSDLVEVFHREGQVASADFTEDGTTICGQLPPRLVARFRPFLAGDQPRARRHAKRSAAPAVATP
ncbi:MAG TPA: GTPase HflX [Thermomicrobiales bacterium]|nr:GTPase HflX [Thermomicrobiales bacterium]